ncbi:competence/damage-inducible protein A [Allorhodopirellula solitaria]|uniref:CinA-like protein n=1 Tax=Allorhodopirellula solitaria TaxID=2527987 RepID=A0A5C5YK13_9BACT|nr:molybdopterin-binding protein [Allorhodopirellula solitaria]TWT75158.1 putative competence-damage inducible protein [Allorhodopirellula solitaria]
MAHLTAEIISIGDEMTSGSRLDTNTAWISRRLAELGVEVHFHSTVGDTLSHNIDVFRIAVQRADLVVATGGLGPTRDDLTREAIAESLGMPLQFDADSFARIEAMFTRRGRQMPERNRRQAMFPRGANPILNPQGTAPGVDVVATRPDGSTSRIFALPGVPAEMTRMFDDSVAPAILSIAEGGKHIRNSVMKFFGLGESDMEQRLGEMISRQRQPRVGITVSAATISLRISALADSVAECEAMIATTHQEIMQRVGDLYFGDGETFEQQHAVDAQLRDRNERLCVIELGHAAPLGDWFAALGDSPVLAGGLSLVGNAELRHFAGLDTSDATHQDCVQKIGERFTADWMVVVDAYPDLNRLKNDVTPASDVTFSVGHPDGRLTSQTENIGGHPSIVHARIAKAALQYLRQCLAEATCR